MEREYPYVPALSNLYGWLRQFAYMGRLLYKGIEVPTPPIVDQDTWDRAQVQLDRQTANPRNPRRTYTLAGLLICGGCGSRIRGHARGHLTYYRCRNHTPSCRPRPYVRADELEGQVWREVTDVLMNPDLLVRRFMDNSDDTIAEDVRHAEREVTKWATRNERLITLFVSGDITKAEFDRQRKFVAEPLEDAQQRLDDVRERLNQQAAQQNLGGLFEAYWQAMFMYSPHLLAMTPEQQRDCSARYWTGLLWTAIMNCATGSSLPPLRTGPTACRFVPLNLEGSKDSSLSARAFLKSSATPLLRRSKPAQQLRRKELLLHA